MRAVIVCCVSILSTLMAVSPCEGQYTVTDLGVLPGGGFAAGLAISPNGNFVVGMSYLTFSPSPFTSVLFTGGMLVDIGSLGGDFSQANGVNDDGVVVGESTAGPGLGEGHVYLYRDGEMTDLGLGSAAAINGSGLVVGRYFFQPGNLLHAFLYDGNEMVDLGNLGGNGPSESTAINQAGQIVGVASGTSFTEQAFRWEAATGMVDLGTLGRSAAATAMNDVDQVAGWSVTPDGYTTAVLYESGSVIDLGTLGGCQELFCSVATGINNSGQVVGRAHLPGGAETPFLYQDGVMMNLNDLISDPGWRMRLATAINDAGQIVGAAVPPGEDYVGHAVLLTPTAMIDHSR